MPWDSQSTMSRVDESQELLALMCSSKSGPLLATVTGVLSLEVTVPSLRWSWAFAWGNNGTLVSLMSGVPHGSVIRK